jgi:hypothetical protein
MVFEARFAGMCQVCDEPIEVGQPIRLAGLDHRGYRHDVCPELAEPARPGYLAPRTSTEEMGY